MKRAGRMKSNRNLRLLKKTWLDLVHWKKDKVTDDESRVYFKNIRMYADSKLVIDNYKSGAVCIFRLNPWENPEAQGMMNYICGGIYALDGEVVDIGGDVFMVSRRGD